MARLKSLRAPIAWIGAGALGLWVCVGVGLGVGFVNYDTVYSLAWGQQLSRGQLPTYRLPIAPTPHPLTELLGVVLAPLGPAATLAIVVGLAYVSLAALAYVLYRLGTAWFSWPVGLAAAVLIVTRDPILNYGARSYVDIPYVVLVLTALLIETRRPRAGWPVLVLLDLAGLLRPEAWLLSGAYWLYLVPRRSPAELARLAGLAALAPVLWVASDLAITGDALWSLSHTRATAQTLHRVTGITSFPVNGAKAIGGILRPDGAIAAAIGGLLSIWLLPRRSIRIVVTGAVSLVAFGAVASSGLPIQQRYAFLPACLLAVFAGAGLFGWRSLPADHRARRPWQAAAVAIGLVAVAFVPSQISSIRSTFISGKQPLRSQQQIQDDLTALVSDRAINLRCGPVGVPFHTPVPLLALRLHTSPANVLAGEIGHGVFVSAANARVLQVYLLDPRDPPITFPVPAGFHLVLQNRSWRVYQRCS
ncbi:MAG TPA: hypothetical protein VHW26_09170 [Solirubrobacteraceae bacterium]|jgi:hypothetical protein|nr:hypothetical protein [Solirubrobacteraceae bacterium]